MVDGHFLWDIPFFLALNPQFHHGFVGSTPSVQGLPWAFWVSLSLELTMGTSSSVSRRMERMAVARRKSQAGRDVGDVLWSRTLRKRQRFQISDQKASKTIKNLSGRWAHFWCHLIQTPSKAWRNNHWR